MGVLMCPLKQAAGVHAAAVMIDRIKANHAEDFVNLLAEGAPCDRDCAWYVRKKGGQTIGNCCAIKQLAILYTVK
jgi:hypothetical protein